MYWLVFNTQEFLSRIEDASFDVWDHYTHLRIAWLVLTKYGRREGVAKIFQLIKHFIEVSPRTKRSDTTRGRVYVVLVHKWSCDYVDVLFPPCGIIHVVLYDKHTVLWCCTDA